MAENGTFRTALFGGYNKEDVDEYIKTLEHEIESIKVLHQKEKLELMRRAEDSEAELALVREDLESARDKMEKTETGDQDDLEALQILEEETAKAKAAETDKGALLQLQAAYDKLEEENRRLQEQLEKKDDLFDYDTVIKIMEEARTNAELIEKEAKQKADQMIEEAKDRALAEEEKQRHMITSRVNAQLEEKGVQLMAAKYKIEQYIKEIEGAQQGLYLLNTRMEKMVKDMPVRLDDYWEGEEFRQLEKKDDDAAEKEK
nr:hypothetical protein [uncultured Merdimonas sp.]